ncbi:MAG: methyl-accepting chemotaxis protein [Oligoflexia bacterium]|nr:methyl-accepting chemotaxis protein [Oligoflexia bacterium]
MKKKYSLGTKIFLLTVLPNFLLLFWILGFIYTVYKQQAEVETQLFSRTEVERIVNEISLLLVGTHESIYQYLIAISNQKLKGNEALEGLKKEISTIKEKITLAQGNSILNFNEEKESLQSIMNELTQFEKHAAYALELVQITAAINTSELDKSFTTINNTAKLLLKWEKENLLKIYEQLKDKRKQYVMMAVILLGVVMILVWVLSRSIGLDLIFSIRRIQHSMMLIFKGKLSQEGVVVKNNEGESGIYEIQGCLDAISQMSSILSKVNASIGDMVLNIVDGRLSQRADGSHFEGAYQEIILGINQIVDEMLGPIEGLLVVLQRMDNGDMSKRMEGRYRGDHAQIKNSLNTTIDELNKILWRVKVVAQEVGNATQSVLSNNRFLVSGAQSQASAVEEILKSMEDIGNRTLEAAKNAKGAQELGQQIKINAEEGNKQMLEMLTAMGAIDDSGQSISKIIKTIDEIAFQTNLLALNAAVEAARAGKHGKGFAVVAEEVKNLATRSAEAAQETAALIENSRSKVSYGQGITKSTVATFDQIVTRIGSITGFVDSVAKESSEQSQVFMEVNKGLNQVGQIVYDNLRVIENNKRAVDLMDEKFTIMSGMLNGFKLDEQPPEQQTFEVSKKDGQKFK